ncbi:MAG: hypothetical protein ACRDWG_20260 [Actinomycetes bacterium]|jgi:hypothetical protein
MLGRTDARSRHTALPVLLAGLALLAVPLAGCGQEGVGDAAGTGSGMTSPAPSTPSTPGSDEPSPTSRPPTADPSTPGPTGSPPPANGVLTMTDNGKVIRMAVGESVRLQLDPPWRWETPTVRGDAVMVYPLNNIMDSGHQEWIIQAVKPGQATVRAFGDAMCPPGTQCLIGDKIVEITVRVTG